MAFESIITKDTEVCFICGSRYGIDRHHCLHGRFKALAERYKLVVPLCRTCHMRLHDKDTEMDRYLQRVAQEAWEREHQGESFLKRFGKNFK